MDKYNRLTVSDIPSEMMEAMRRQFDDAPQVRQLRTQQQLLMRKGSYQGALELGKRIDELYNAFVAEYIRQANDDAENVDVRKIGLTDAQLATVDTITLALFMCCDIIDSCILDINNVLATKDSTLRYEAFDEIKDLSRMVKGKLSILQGMTSFMEGNVWSDIVDNMYKMMFNKAKSIISKKGEKLID
jgi:hypothetical protein